MTIAPALCAWKIHSLEDSVLELLPHIPFLVLMSSFYSFITLNTELKTKNIALAKFIQCFAACGGARIRLT